MITRATAADEAAIRTCAQQAYQRYVASIGKAPAPMAADFRAQIAAGQVYVHRSSEGALQGFIVFYPTANHMQLESVAVLPDWAGQGIGKALIEFCESTAQRAGLAAVQLYTNEKMTDNLAIYPRLGYVEVERRSEDGFRRVFFTKALA